MAYADTDKGVACGVREVSGASKPSSYAKPSAAAAGAYMHSMLLQTQMNMQHFMHLFSDGTKVGV